MFLVTRIRRGVPVLVHWSVPALSLFVLGTGVNHIVNAAAWIVGYLAILIIHELGHQIAAERRRVRVLAISIYPLHGNCKHEAPRSPTDVALIALGGSAAQLIVAVPLALFAKFFGSTGVGALDIIVANLALISPVVAFFNLLPIAPLDGHRAWVSLRQIIRMRRSRRHSPNPRTAMEALEDALRKASKSGGA